MANSAIVPDDVLAAAKAHAYAVEGTFDGGDITSFNGVRVIAQAILAERNRCAGVANERALQLARGAELMPFDKSFASQMVEAVLIEQRISSGWVAEGAIRIQGAL